GLAVRFALFLVAFGFVAFGLVHDVGIGAFLGGFGVPEFLVVFGRVAAHFAARIGEQHGRFAGRQSFGFRDLVGKPVAVISVVYVTGCGSLSRSFRSAIFLAAAIAAAAAAAPAAALARLAVGVELFAFRGSVLRGRIFAGSLFVFLALVLVL